MQSTEVTTNTVVRRLPGNADQALDADRAAAKSYLARATELLRGEHPEPTPALTEVSSRGRLAQWQIQKVFAYVEEHIDTTIRTAALARLIRLSPSYFPVIFKQTFGETPHVYLTRRRIERAQKLMLTTDSLLGEIALECGFCDQGHFCRVFLRQVGVTPTRWRRQRAMLNRSVSVAAHVG